MNAKTIGTHGVVALALLGWTAPLALAGPATEPATPAPPLHPDDATFVTAMQELGGRAEESCCSTVCFPSPFGYIPVMCTICCPPPGTVPKCGCDPESQMPYCECVIIP